MRTRWLVLSLSLAAVLPGCAAGGSDDAPGHWTPGKGDGSFDLVEVGPAPVGGSVDLSLDGRVPAYRVQSFGGTQVTIDLVGEAANPYLVVEGPLDNYGDTVAVGGGTVIGEDDDSGPGNAAHLELALAQAGVYRILAGTHDSLGEGGAASGQLTLSVACGANCWRPMIDQQTFVQQVQQQSGGAFASYAQTELGALVPDPTVAAELDQQLDSILGGTDLSALDRFPLIALSDVAAIRPALGAIPSSTPAPDQVIAGDLVMLLGPCTPDRSLPADLTPALPGVKYGQFPSVTLSPCQFAHAGKLAQILTSLAAQNGSSVTYRGQTITSPRDLFAALVASGHTIEVRNERMYANFLSLMVGDKDLIWPVWIDTGIQLSSGDSFTIPVGHSQQEWRITGPDVDTRVTFFLGISGAGFFGQTDARPAWSGTIASTDYTIASASDENYDFLLTTVDTAAAYLRRNAIESTTVAAGMPADGYGYVGVCNDSNATVELVSAGTISTFPLLRAAALDGDAPLDDGLDEIVVELPKDGDGLPDPADALRRAVAMQPFPDGSPLMWDAVLGAQIATARQDVAGM